jgi:hypothetical protein
MKVRKGCKIVSGAEEESLCGDRNMNMVEREKSMREPY